MYKITNSIFVLFITITIGLFLPSVASCSDNPYAVILQRQSKQIQSLVKRLEVLEKIIKQTINDQALLDLLPKEDVLEHYSENNNLQQQKDNSKIEKKDDLNHKEKEEYDLSLASFKSGDYVKAEEGFWLFMDKYPLSSLQSNASFWYAESLYNRGLFDKASIFYLKGYKKYPNSLKAPSNLLKLSYCLAKIEKKEQACGILRKLDIEFPNRSEESIKRTREAKLEFLCE